MKKHLLDLLAPLLLAIILTGCGVGLGAAQPTEEALPPLKATEWPTPPPAIPPASPTPFPKITLEPTATPTASPTPLATSDILTTTESSLNDNTDKLMGQTNTAGGGLTPVAVALVTTDNVAVRQGPGASYPVVGPVAQGELAAIFGKNPAGDWLYGLTVSELQGWLPVNSLRVTGTLEKAPVLPPNPLAHLATPLALATPTPSTGSSAAGNPSPALTDLKPVAKARVNNDGLNVRQGPGATYQVLDTLSRNDEVAILALNPAKDWALIETAKKQRGWVSLAYLAVEGSIADAPVLSVPAPSQSLSQNQTVSGPTVIKAAVTTGDDSSLTPAAAIGSNPLSAINDLIPIATARIKINQMNVRPGPSTDDAPIATITDNQEEISVLALDKSRSWALVKPAFTHLGWVSLSDLNVNSSMADAPQIFTAWVKSNEIQARSGPGIYDDGVGAVAINSLIRVLGVDETRSWALIKPIPGGGLGWVPTQFIKLDTHLADLPVVKAEGGRRKDEGELPIANSQLSIVNSQPHLVFQLSSGGDIMVINPDGIGLRRLTHGLDPVLSPDGKTVAFTRWEGETGSLWLINIDGTNEHSILGFIKQAKGPDWSPDGSKIVLNFQHEGRLENKMDCSKLSKGQNPPHPPQNAFDIKVELKDHQPYFCWTLPPDPHWGLRVVNLADSSFEDLYGGQYTFRPAWDPSQAWRIVADAGNGLLETDVTRDNHHNITDRIEDGSPVFSPDGRYLAVTSGQQGGNQGYDIFRLNHDGSGRVRLTETPLWVPVTSGDHKLWNNVSPAWSPDGSQIAFLTDRTGRWEIWVMNADGSNEHSMFSEEVNNQLQFTYNFVDERMLSWR